MNKKLLAIFIYLIVGIVSLACANKSQNIQPSINTAEFPGFVINKHSSYQDVTLDGYEYALSEGETISFANCPQVEEYDENKIADYDFYRFRLLRVSCAALKKYLSAQSYQKMFFSEDFGVGLVNKLPAVSIPLLNKPQQSLMAGTTIGSKFPGAVISKQENGTVKVVTEEDEIYYSLMALGDFNGDGIGDLLVRSEWYARNASGKHADLIILSKTTKERVISIVWRKNNPEKTTGP
jgi:hypothetical protein